jgi:hypothetical protein
MMIVYCQRLLGLIAVLLVAASQTHAETAVISSDFNAGIPAGATLFGSASHLSAPLTTQTFDGGGTAHTFSGSGSQTIQPGGISANFLRLAPNANGQSNNAAFNRTTTGAMTRMVLDFDFRMGGGTSPPADGLGLAFLATGTHGISGAGPGFSEEANVSNSFGAGFDIFDNGGADSPANHISYHFNGGQQGANQAFNSGTQINLSDNQWHHANVVLNWTGPTTAQATTTFTNNLPGGPVVATQTITGISPYEARLALQARTGGLNANHDIDNVVVDWGPISQGGVQLTPAANGQLGGLSIDANTVSGAEVAGFDASFDFRGRPGTVPGADGFSFSLVRGNNVGAFSEEGAPTGLAIAFDSFNNGGPDPNDNHLQVYFDGAAVTGGLVSSLPINLDDGNIHTADIDFLDGALSVSLDGNPVLSNLLIPGFDPYDGQFNFGARTGGLNANFFIDNFDATVQLTPEPSAIALWVLLGFAAAGMTLGRRPWHRSA